MGKVRYAKIDEDTLREFAAELKRLTNFSISDEVVEMAIRAVKPKLIKED